MEQTINDVGYEVECGMIRCGSVTWSNYPVERCPNCGSTSLKVIKDSSEEWENAGTESII